MALEVAPRAANEFKPMSKPRGTAYKQAVRDTVALEVGVWLIVWRSVS